MTERDKVSNGISDLINTIADHTADMQEEIASLKTELARRDETISRLKEDAERLASNVYTTIDEDGNTWCVACHNYNDEHTEYCPITLHRALMKKLEGK